MGARLAMAFIIVLGLAAWLSAAPAKPQLTDAGVYEVNYEIDKAGGIVVKSIRLSEPTEELSARPGVAFGVCLGLSKEIGLPPQAGYLYPEGGDKDARFWGVETSFERQGRPTRFYGFVFGAKSSPVPGTYGVTLYRADDGSLLARQLFKVVAAKAKEGGQ